MKYLDLEKYSPKTRSVIEIMMGEINLSSIDKYISTYWDSFIILEIIADFLRMTGIRKDKAIQLRKRLLEIDSNAKIMHLNLANSYCDKNELEYAEFHAEKSIEAIPDNPRTLNLMGEIYFIRYRLNHGKEEYFYKAESWYKRAKNIDPNRLLPYFNLAKLYLYAKQFDHAFYFVKQAFELVKHHEGKFRGDIDIINAKSIKKWKQLTNANHYFFVSYDEILRLALVEKELGLQIAMFGLIASAQISEECFNAFLDEVKLYYNELLTKINVNRSFEKFDNMSFFDLSAQEYIKKEIGNFNLFSWLSSLFVTGYMLRKRKGKIIGNIVNFVLKNRYIEALNCFEELKKWVLFKPLSNEERIKRSINALDGLTPLIRCSAQFIGNYEKSDEIIDFFYKDILPVIDPEWQKTDGYWKPEDAKNLFHCVKKILTTGAYKLNIYHSDIIGFFNNTYNIYSQTKPIEISLYQLDYIIIKSIQCLELEKFVDLLYLSGGLIMKKIGSIIDTKPNDEIFGSSGRLGAGDWFISGAMYYLSSAYLSLSIGKIENFLQSLDSFEKIFVMIREKIKNEDDNVNSLLLINNKMEDIHNEVISLINIIIHDNTPFHRQMVLLFQSEEISSWYHSYIISEFNKFFENIKFELINEKWQELESVLSRAESYSLQAFNFYDKGHSIGLAIMMGSIGIIYMPLGFKIKAEELFRAGLELIQKSEGEYFEKNYAYQVMALLGDKLDLADETLDICEKALDDLENILLPQFKSPEEQNQFASRYINFINTALKMIEKKGNVCKKHQFLLNKMERFRSRFLRQLMMMPKNNGQNTINSAIDVEVTKLFPQKSDDSNLDISAILTTENLSKIDVLFYKKRKELFSDKNIKTDLPNFEKGDIGKELRILKKSYKDNSEFQRVIALALYPLENNFLLYAENDKGESHVSFYPYENTNQKDIYRSVAKFIDITGTDKQNKNICFEELNKLAGPIFINPINEALTMLDRKDKNTVLFLAGHHWMGQLPLHALSPTGDDKSFLDETVTCVYLPSLSFLKTMTERRKNYIEKQGKSIITGYLSESKKDTDFTNDFLGKIAEEIKNGEIQNITIEDVINLPEYIDDFFILAHGLNIEDNAFLSCLCINNKRPLFVNDLLNVKEKNIDMAVTASCLSYLSTRYRGDELLGIAYSLILLGARSVVANLWSVPVEDTATVLLNFYKARKEGLNKAQALKAARRHFRWRGREEESISQWISKEPTIRAGKSPYSWAGPVLIGDPF
ncbi:MAG: CHAT domain-containing protein [Desulfococcaceae bacterium]